MSSGLTATSREYDVRKQYGQFKELYTQLMYKFPAVGRFAFPGRNMFCFELQSVKESRQSKFNEFCKLLLSLSVKPTAEIAQFFELKPNDVEEPITAQTVTTNSIATEILDSKDIELLDAPTIHQLSTELTTSTEKFEGKVTSECLPEVGIDECDYLHEVGVDVEEYLPDEVGVDEVDYIVDESLMGSIVNIHYSEVQSNVYSQFQYEEHSQLHAEDHVDDHEDLPVNGSGEIEDEYEFLERALGDDSIEDIDLDVEAF